MTTSPFLSMIPGLDSEELLYLQHLTKDLSDDQKRTFVMIYNGKRKSADTILICTLLGFIVIAGVQRFMTGQIGMGILYLFTGGLCFIGTIIDAINYKKMAYEYNQQQAMESLALVGSGIRL